MDSGITMAQKVLPGGTSLACAGICGLVVKLIYSRGPKWHIVARQRNINREANRETD